MNWTVNKNRVIQMVGRFHGGALGLRYKPKNPIPTLCSIINNGGHFYYGSNPGPDTIDKLDTTIKNIQLKMDVFWKVISEKISKIIYEDGRQ